MKDAAVNRLAKSITQLTLCQVTTSEDAATKLFDKACQKLQGIQDVPSQRVTDLEAAIRQLRQLSCILDSCTISASYEVSQAQKAILLLPHTAKGASTSSEELNAQMMSIIFQLMKTIGKSTSVPESTANPGSSPMSRFGRNAHQASTLVQCRKLLKRSFFVVGARCLSVGRT